MGSGFFIRYRDVLRGIAATLGVVLGVALAPNVSNIVSAIPFFGQPPAFCGKICNPAEAGACASGICRLAGYDTNAHDVYQCWSPACGPTGGCGTACQTNLSCDPNLTCDSLPGGNGRFCGSGADAGRHSDRNGSGQCNAGAVPGSTIQPGGCYADCLAGPCDSGLTCTQLDYTDANGFTVYNYSFPVCWGNRCLAGGRAQGQSCSTANSCAIGLHCATQPDGTSTCQPIGGLAAAGGPAPGTCGASCDPLQKCVRNESTGNPYPPSQCPMWQVYMPPAPTGGPLRIAFYRCQDANDDHICDIVGVPCVPPADFTCTLGGCPPASVNPHLNPVVCSPYQEPLSGCIQGVCSQQSSGVFACGGVGCSAKSPLLGGLPTEVVTEGAGACIPIGDDGICSKCEDPGNDPGDCGGPRCGSNCSVSGYCGDPAGGWVCVGGTCDAPQCNKERVQPPPKK